MEKGGGRGKKDSSMRKCSLIHKKSRTGGEKKEKNANAQGSIA